MLNVIMFEKGMDITAAASYNSATHARAQSQPSNPVGNLFCVLAKICIVTVFCDEQQVILFRLNSRKKPRKKKHQIDAGFIFAQGSPFSPFLVFVFVSFFYVWDYSR